MIQRRKKPRRGRVIDHAYLEWQASQPCCITAEWPATTHHVRFFGSPKDDTRTIRLIASLHQLGARRKGIPCIEDGKAIFEAFHRIDIETEILKARTAYEQNIRRISTESPNEIND